MYITGSIENWENFAQTGIMVQTCACPDGFGGIGCEIPVERCMPDYDGPPDPNDPDGGPSYRCQLSGKPCDALPDGSRTCACHVADAVDRTLAGYVCRHWNTEYCYGRLDLSQPHIYLCTNGGKCQSDFIAAQIAPGDLSVNQQYADAGCVCGQHFYGPHCEFLDFDAKHNIVLQKENGGIVPFQEYEDDDNDDGWQAKHFLIILVGIACITMISMAVYRRHRRRHQAYLATLVHASTRDGVFRDDDDGDVDVNNNNNNNNSTDNDRNGTIEFADDHRHQVHASAAEGDHHDDMYAHEFVDTTTPMMEDVNLEEPVSMREDDDDDDDDDEESPVALQPPVSSVPTLAKATSLRDDDEEEDNEDNLPYFT